MPGKYIDRAILALASAVIAYLYFLNAWGSIPLACILSFICCALAAKLLRRRPVHFKCTAPEAASEIMRIAAMPESDATARLEEIILRRYPGESFILSPILKHPSGSVSMGDVFSLWKKHQGEERLLIACTCGADPRAIMYARELESPRVAIIEKKRLMRFIRLAGMPDDRPKAVPLMHRLKRIPQNIAMHCHRPRNVLAGLVLIALYMLNGSPLCLISGLVNLFLFGCTLPGRQYRRSLF